MLFAEGLAGRKAAEAPCITLPETTRAPVELKPTPRPQTPETVVILGWHHTAAFVLFELDPLLPKSSTVYVYAEESSDDRTQHISDVQKRNNLPDFENIKKVEHKEGRLGSYAMFSEIPVVKASRIFLMSDRTLDHDKADALNVATILQLEDYILANGSDKGLPPLVPEIRDSVSAKTCALAGISDHVDIAFMQAQLLTNCTYDSLTVKVLREVLSPQGA